MKDILKEIKASPGGGGIKRRSVRETDPGSVKSNPAGITTLNERHRKFCQEYIEDFNATRAYKAAYPGTSEAAARSSSANLLTNSNIQQYLKQLISRIEDKVGVSKTYLVNELLKIAESPCPVVHTKAEYEALSENERRTIKSFSCITLNVGSKSHQEMQSKVTVTYYSKLDCYELIADILGYRIR